MNILLKLSYIGKGIKVAEVNILGRMQGLICGMVAKSATLLSAPCLIIFILERLPMSLVSLRLATPSIKPEE